MEQRADIAIIGGGMASQRLLEELVERGFTGTIVVFCAEAFRPYNRILLSPLLAGECEAEALFSRDTRWYAQHGIQLHVGDAVVAVDVNTHQLWSHSGRRWRWTQLVFATGSRPVLPTVAGIDLPGVLSFRDWRDADRLRRIAGAHSRAVVVGGGLLGLEAAAALRTHGTQVSVVHRGPQLMNRQLDVESAALLRAELERRGIDCYLQRRLLGIDGERGAETVTLDDGTQLAAEAVILTAGIEAEAQLARNAGLAVERGIVVDEALRSSSPGVYALGECCQLAGETFGLVAPIWQQAAVLAQVLCGDTARYQGSAYITSLKVSGIAVHRMGELTVLPGDRDLRFRDDERGVYKRILLRDHNVVGALLYGDVADSQRYFQLMTQRVPISGDPCRLLIDADIGGESLAA